MSTGDHFSPAQPDPTASAPLPPAYGAPYGTMAPYRGGLPAGMPMGAAPIGQIRNTGTCILLTFVTFGIYSWVWYFKTHEEMKRHTNAGVGGGLALVLAMFASIVMPFISASEVGGLYERRGQRAPVNGATGLWFLLLTWFFLVGAIVWFVKVNGALNEYWRSQGAR